jgi:hypothetical protein
MQTKVCTKCHEEKEIDKFYKQLRGKYGVSSICILCEKSPSARKKFLVPKGFKICNVCNQEKSLSEFFKDSRVSTGVIGRCKICDKDKYKDNRVINRKRNRKRNNDRTLQKLYGITLVDYNRMFQEQNGICAICGQPELQKNQFGVIRLAVDHNHIKGKVRGLLCSKCNKAIGIFNDDISLLESAINYLKTRN